MQLLNKIKKILKRSTLSAEERWLSQSTDLVELERRQRQLQFGQVKHIGGGLFQKKQTLYR